MIIYTFISLIYILICASFTQSYQTKRPSSSASCHRQMYCLKPHDNVHIKSPVVLMVSNHPIDDKVNLSTYRPYAVGINQFAFGPPSPHSNKYIPSALSLSLLLPIILSIFIMPSSAIASAQDSLQLLHGYHSRTPEIASWIVLISAIVFIQNRLERFLSSF